MAVITLIASVQGLYLMWSVYSNDVARMGTTSILGDKVISIYFWRYAVAFILFPLSALEAYYLRPNKKIEPDVVFMPERPNGKLQGLSFEYLKEFEDNETDTGVLYINTKRGNTYKEALKRRKGHKSQNADPLDYRKHLKDE